MVKIEITSKLPFQFLHQGKPNIAISFTVEDVRKGNLMRVLAHWDESLLKLEQAGLIRILERPENDQSAGDNGVPNIDEEPEPIEPVRPADSAKPKRKYTKRRG